MQQRFYKDFNISTALKGKIKADGVDKNAVAEDCAGRTEEVGNGYGKGTGCNFSRFAKNQHAENYNHFENANTGTTVDLGMNILVDFFGTQYSTSLVLTLVRPRYPLPLKQIL